MKFKLSNYLTKPGWRNLPVLILLVVIWLAIVYSGGKEVLANAYTKNQLVVYVFSTQEDVLTQAIFPAFEQKWEAETGQELSIEGVFCPPGTISGEINLGASPDVASFSNARQVMWLKVGRRVDRDTQPIVIVTTPIIIVTRPGNPAGITGFADPAKPGVDLMHANYRSSGAGEWAILAEYGSALLGSGSHLEAVQQLKGIWRNVHWLAPSARAVMMLFEIGTGDAFVTYEQDAEFALDRGIPLEIVIPSHTIVAHQVAVIVDDTITSTKRPLAEAFLRYLQSVPGQQIFP